jgi:predicted permease
LDPAQRPVAHYYAVTAGYFQVLGIPLLRGRSFGAQDVAGAPRVALINQEMARLHFPNTDPLGQRISLGNGPEAWRKIIGIVGNVKQNGRDQPTRAQIYDPFAQNPSASTTFVVQTTLSATDLAAAVRSAVHSLDPDIPLNIMYPFAGGLERGMAVRRFMMLLFGVFAVTALCLAAIGVYGVMTYTVAQRTGEIGIRMALGAQRRDVLWLVLRQGGRMVGAGVLIGLAGAFAVSHLLAWILFEVNPHDPLTLVVIVVLLLTVAFFACWLRATRVNPLVALRCE